MRKLLTFLLLFPLALFAQVPDSIATYLQNYTVQDRTVSYIKVYEMEGKNKAMIKDLLVSSFSGVPKVSINQNSISDDQIIGVFSDHKIDFRQYGGKWGNTAVWVQYPMSGRFTFQIKDNKYRLIITDIVAIAPGVTSLSFNSDFATKENTLRAVNTKTGYTGYYYFARSMEDLFNPNKGQKKDDW